MSKRRNPRLPREKGVAGPAEPRAERARRLTAEGARLLTERRNAEAALRLAEAWELDPTNAATAINLGGAYILLGQHKRARPVLEAAARLEPDNAMVWINLAAAYLGKLTIARPDDQDRAIVAFQRALALDPQAPHVHYNLGLIYIERNDMHRAAEYFQQALDVDPFDSDARTWLARIQQLPSQDDEAPQG